MKMLKKYVQGQPLSIALIVIIWVLCLMPAREFPTVHYNLADKWVHFLMFGSMTLVILWEYGRRHKQVEWPRLLIGALLLPVVMGCLVELAQAWLTTTRSGDWFDALADSIGVVLGWIVYLLKKMTEMCRS